MSNTESTFSIFMNTPHNTLIEYNEWILDEQTDGFGQSNSFKLSFKYPNVAH